MHVKAAHKMLVKSTPGVNFINVLFAAFTPVDLKSAKMAVKSSVVLRHLELKAARKQVGEIEP